MSAPRALQLLLRIAGAIMMLAVIAVIMPRSWMAWTNAALGLAPLPEQPIFDYLARSISALYAIYGVLHWVMADDVVRYRPIILVSAVTGAMFAVAIFIIDLSIGMPLQWTAAEGPSILALSLVTLALLRKVPR
jgi:hypothetical protein